MFIGPTLASAADQIIDAQKITHNGREITTVPHTVENVTALRRSGLDVDSPILHYYDWLGNKPFDPVQTNTAAMMVQERRAFVFNRMGTGKTRSAIFAFDYLRKEGMVHKMLVVGTLSTLARTWLRECLMVAPHYKTVNLHHSTKKGRLRALSQPHDVAVINYDGVKVLLDSLVGKYDVIVCDEASALRNATTGRWKALQRVSSRCKYLWLMTGTPTPKAPTDGHGLLKIAYPHHPMAKSFVRFRDKTMHKITQFKWVPKDDAHETLEEWLVPQVQYNLDDVMELPTTAYSYEDVTLSNQQEKVYEALRQACIDKVHDIKALNAGVLLSKLVQICSGVVLDSKGNAVKLDDPRLEVARDIVEENDRHSIIFVPFVRSANRVYEYLRAQGLDACIVHGGISMKERNKVFARFQDRPSKWSGASVLVAQPDAMAHGLTLTEANLILWYAPITNYETYEQANARIVRPGQTSKTRIVHLRGSRAEREVYRALSTKEKNQEKLLKTLASNVEMW